MSFDGGLFAFAFTIHNLPMNPSDKKKTDTLKVVCQNRKARANYDLEKHFEAGIALVGSEVKVLRAGQGQISEAYAEFRNGELFLVGMHLPEYTHASLDAHSPLRKRKLLLHKRELERLEKALKVTGITLVPLQLYFKGKHIKIELALAKGKKEYDKRQDIKKRENDRSLRRVVKMKR